MDKSRIRQRRLMRWLIEDEVFDLDVIDEAAIELGLEPVAPEIEPIMIEVAAKPVIRLPRETRNDGHGAVYVIKNPNGLYKIGSARNADSRIKTLQTGSAEILELVLTIPTHQHTHYALERTLHSRLSKKRVQGEWFALEPEDITALKALIQP